jgi:hypothetical protein
MPGIMNILAARPSAAAASFSLAWTASEQIASASSPYNYSSSNSIGAADSNRMVVAAFAWFDGGGASNITAVTIGGVSATLTAADIDSGGISGVEIWTATVPTGTTAQVVATKTGLHSMHRMTVHLSRVVGHSSNTPTDTITATGTSSATGGIDVPANGGAIGVSSHATSSSQQGYESASKTYVAAQTNITVGVGSISGSNATWTELTEDAGSQTSASSSGTARVAFCAAAWGP